MLQLLSAEPDIEQIFPSLNFTLKKDNRVQRRKLKQGLLNAGSGQEEMKAALTVERGHQIIEAEINAFTSEKMESVKLYVSPILAGKVKVETCLFQEILNKNEIGELCQAIKHALQLEIGKCFGTTSDELAAYQVYAQDCVSINQLVTSVNEYRKGLLFAAGATELGNRIWRQSLKQLKLNYLCEELAQDLKLGSIYMKTADCDSRMLAKRYCGQLEQELAGTILSISHNIKLSLRKKFTQIFYGMYDHAHAHRGDSAINGRNNKQIRGFRGRKRPRYGKELVLFDQQAM